MSSFAVRVTQSLLARSLPTGYLKVATPTSVTVRQNGVALVGATYADNAKAALANPVPLNVDPGSPGVSTRGELLVFLNPGRGYDAAVVIGTSTTIVPLQDVSLDSTEPIPSGTVTEAMLAFNVATQVELDAGLATKQATIPSGTYVLGGGRVTKQISAPINPAVDDLWVDTDDDVVTTTGPPGGADPNAVHLTGAETISGAKTFIGAALSALVSSLTGAFVSLTGIDSITGAKSFIARTLFQAPDAATSPIVAKAAASQIASIQEWQDSGGAVMSAVLSGGGWRGPSLGDITGQGPFVTLNSTQVRFNPRLTTSSGFIVLAAPSQTGNLCEWQNSGSGLLSAINAGGTYIADIAAGGIVLRDTANRYWRVTINTAGVLTTADLGTTRPTT